MRNLKTYKLFENKLENKLDIDELERFLIDFIQMGLSWDASISSSYIIDWDSLDSISLDSSIIQEYSKGIISNTLTIDLSSENITGNDININELEDAYGLLSSYLDSKYNLCLNYIYIKHNFDFLYFETMEALRVWAFGGKYKGVNIKARQNNDIYLNMSRITLGFMPKSD
jgi:hypothetical protein